METTLFWIVAGALTLAVLALLVRALMRGRVGADPAAAYDLRVYRDQLREVDRDLARGVISGPEAERLRTEISRRVLDADRALDAGDSATTPGVARTVGVVLVAATVLAGAFGIYNQLGAPGYPDLPLAARIAAADDARANRPRQDAAEAQATGRLPPAPVLEQRHADLIAQLRRAVAERPNDLQGQELMARNMVAIGDYAAAHRAQLMVVTLKGPAATATDYATLAELMIAASAGYVSPEAESALTEALKRDPSNGAARYYSGLMFAQTGRPDMAFRFWRPLLEQSGPDDAWVPAIRAQIEEIAMRAGVDYTLPEQQVRGPSAADVEAAADMTPEARQQMIRGMVDQLSSRLASEGGTAEDWARLIRALGVLGDVDRARAIWSEAAGVFADRPADLAVVRAAASDTGVAQ